MKKLFVPLAAAGILIGSSAIVAAQSSNSAKEFAPGQQDRLPGDQGARNFAPGQLQTSPGEAKDFAPGQMKKETTGSSATSKSKDTKTKVKPN
jgi:hypothetical protein